MVATTERQEKQVTALTQFNRHLSKMKDQMNLVLPKHMTPDRMARLALTAFNGDSKLQQCSFDSIAASVLTAAAMGLEIGVAGQGWLVPYKGTATFVPGWMGLLDLLNRTGRASAWTGAVYEGDEFDWELGSNPFVKHKPRKSRGRLTHVYACGRTKDSDWPIIEVWTVEEVKQHRDQYNKVGDRHYSLKDDNNFEKYARKVALLQVLKYLPKSIELQAAVDASYAADQGDSYTIDGDFTVKPQALENRTSDEMDKLADQLDQAATKNGKTVTKPVARQDNVEGHAVEELGESQLEPVVEQPTGLLAELIQRAEEAEYMEELQGIKAMMKSSAKLTEGEKKQLAKLLDVRSQALQYE